MANEKKPTRRELSRAVKQEAAALLESFDLSQLLGDELADAIIDDQELQGYVEEKRDALAQRIRRL